MLDFLSNSEQALRNFATAFVPAFLGIILHEVGHGWMALRQGDPTAKLMGRLTLNPVPHIDPVGLGVFALTSLSGGFVFGWAKPVPIDARNFREPRRGLLLVSLAGPAANILLALLCGLLLKIAILGLSSMADISAAGAMAARFALDTLQYGILINVCLAVFNLLPIPPLDGSKVLLCFLPPSLARPYLSAERWGMLILILLIAAGALSPIVGPLLRGGVGVILDIFSL